MNDHRPRHHAPAPRPTVRRAVCGAVVAAVLASVAACSAESVAAPDVPEVFDLSHDPAAGVQPVDPNRGAVVPADELRLLLENHMAWHGITLVEAMRGAERGDAAAARWIDALQGNTDDITEAVGLVYGPVGARAFHQLWAQHTQFLVDYAAAVGRDDDAAATRARRNLDDYVRDSGSLLDTATGGRLPAATAREVLTTHVEHMVHQLDAAAADDRARSQSLALDDHAYLFGIADALAGAIAGQQPAAFPGDISTDHADHISSMNQAAGAGVIGRLGDDAPWSSEDAPDPFDTASPLVLTEGGWTSAVEAFDRARSAKDARSVVTASKGMLDAADATARTIIGPG